MPVQEQVMNEPTVQENVDPDMSGQREPVTITCPSCQATGMTATSNKISNKQICYSCICFWMIPCALVTWIGCWVPICCCPGCANIQHKCASCEYDLGKSG